MLFKTVIIHNDDHNVPYCTYKTTSSSDSDKVKATVIRAPDAGLLKIYRYWASNRILDNN